MHPIRTWYESLGRWQRFCLLFFPTIISFLVVTRMHSLNITIAWVKWSLAGTCSLICLAMTIFMVHEAWKDAGVLGRDRD